MSLAEQVLSTLRAALPVPVHDGKVPNLPTYPYVVLWIAEPSRTTDRMPRLQVNHAHAWQTSCVGLTGDQARAVQQRVHDALTDARLVVPGRGVQRVQHDGASLLYSDLDPDPEVLIAADTWSVLTVPSPGA